MRKIPTLFKRNHEGDYQVRNEVTLGCEWVIEGQGEATRKMDGTCCMVQAGKLFKRYELKYDKKTPSGFVAADVMDPITKKTPGWVPVVDVPEDKYHREAFNLVSSWLDGTYELIGPKVQRNLEQARTHLLIPHGHQKVRNAPRTFDKLKKYLAHHDIEGIVWHHPDGRLAKIKGRDFGIKRHLPNLLRGVPPGGRKSP